MNQTSDAGVYAVSRLNVNDRCRTSSSQKRTWDAISGSTISHQPLRNKTLTFHAATGIRFDLLNR